MSNPYYESWYDDFEDEDAGLTDAEIEAKYGLNEPEEPGAKATEAGDKLDEKPEAPKTPVYPDFSSIDNAASLDDAIAAVNEAVRAARPTVKEAEPTRTPAEQREFISEALEGATSLKDALARLGAAGLVDGGKVVR